MIFALTWLVTPSVWRPNPTSAPGKSAAIVSKLLGLREPELPRVSGKSKLAEAIRYATSRCLALEIDSNIVERAIAANDRKKERAVRGQPWRRPLLADHSHPAADRKDELPRSARLA